jgi:chromosome segregation ATPase
MGTVRERDAALASANQNVASEGAKLQAVTAALQTAQKTNAALQQELEQTRTASDKLQGENTQLLTANADLNSRQQVALRQNRALNEDLDQLRNEVANMRAGGGSAAGAVTAGATETGGVRTEQPINGVIRDLKEVGGVQTATISVGNVDNVKPQMQFNVIDREGGNFLGYFVVDRVEQNESVGRLSGPHVDQMKKGNEVRTQL